MLHRPNFCCSCGEKVDRIEWHVWSSRRYCELCQTEHQMDEWLPRMLAVFFLLFGLFGIGTSLRGRGDNFDLISSPVALAEQRAGRRAGAAGSTEREGASEGEVPVIERTIPSRELSDAPAPEPRTSHSLGIVRRVPTAATEAERYYYCGAGTKKGTPCSRKVKGGGRCWQHEGKDAIVPEGELEIVTGSK